MRPDGQAEIQMVVPGAPADVAGARQGDLLLSVDGEPVTNQALVAALSGQRPVTLVVQRDGSERTIILYDV